ncbi:MAG: RlmE family RNA methyltransferase [Desulfohalobiaceae bacterium]|nr:RlmE family RNA methyltransferase [Desulfohalobiaceae bacterium]
MKKYRDHFFQKAKQDKYPARSVYKLQEIDRKFSLFRPGQRVLDLGAAPGSWALYVAKKVGLSGQVLAVDRQAVDRDWPQQVEFYQTDVLEPGAEFLAQLKAMTPFDVLISDLAPKTTGIKLRDQTLSYELARAAFDLCPGRLAAGGKFVAKVFDGPDVQELLSAMRREFEKVRGFKPKSSRQESKESFLLGFGYYGQT